MSFAPELGRAVERERRRSGVGVDGITELVLSGAASLRGIERLTGLESLSVDRPEGLRAIAGHPKLASLEVACRGSRLPSLDLEVVTRLPALRELLIRGVRIDDLRPLVGSAIAELEINYCEVRPQRLELPASLVDLDLDGTEGLELFGVCPELRVVDLFGTRTRPLEWVAQQPAIEELWLNDCDVPSLAPLLAMPSPPRWVFMDGDEQGDLDRHRELIAALEARGARFALGWPHEIGVWIPSWNKLSPLEQEPLYLSPGWPRITPEVRSQLERMDLTSLSLDNTAGVRELGEHPTLESLSIVVRGRKQKLEVALLGKLPALRELLLSEVVLDDLRPLEGLPLRSLILAFCEVPAQRFRPPASLVELELDSTSGIELGGVCPELRKLDLWGTNMRPLEWVAQQPAIEEVWLNGCDVPSLEPLLAMPNPPRWVFMDGDEPVDVDRHRAHITALEARGARFAFGWPHDIGIWIPSDDRVSEHEREPLYLSPGWPRTRPDD